MTSSVGLTRPNVRPLHLLCTVVVGWLSSSPPWPAYIIPNFSTVVVQVLDSVVRTQRACSRCDGELDLREDIRERDEGLQKEALHFQPVNARAAVRELPPNIPKWYL